MEIKPRVFWSGKVTFLGDEVPTEVRIVHRGHHHLGNPYILVVEEADEDSLGVKRWKPCKGNDYMVLEAALLAMEKRITL